MILDEFDINQTSKLAGFKSPSMVNYLCREKIVKPSKSGSKGRGKKRYFSFKDVFLLKSINAILSRGISVSKFKTALIKSKEIKHLKADEGTLEGNLGGIRFMFTDGKQVYFKASEKGIYNLTKENQMEFAFILDVEIIHRELVRDVLKIKEKIQLSA